MFFESGKQKKKDVDAKWLEIPAIKLLALWHGCNESLHCRAEAKLDLTILREFVSTRAQREDADHVH